MHVDDMSRNTGRMFTMGPTPALKGSWKVSFFDLANVLSSSTYF